MITIETFYTSQSEVNSYYDTHWGAADYVTTRCCDGTFKVHLFA